MSLQFRRGTTSSIAIITPLEGEPIFATDTKQLFLGDGSTQGGVLIGGGNNVTEIIAGDNITISTSTGVVTINASGGGGASTSTYYNLTATNELRVGPEDGLGQLRFYRDGSNGLSIGSTDPGHDYLMINNQRWIFLNPTSTPGDSSAVVISEQDPQFSILRVNKITPISTYTNVEISSDATIKQSLYVGTGTSRIYVEEVPGDNRFTMYSPGRLDINGNGIYMYPHGTVNIDGGLTANQTSTIQKLSIGLNNGRVSQTAMGLVNSATTMLVETASPNGGHIIFNMNRFGVSNPIAITRSGGISLKAGQQIVPGASGGLEMYGAPAKPASIADGDANNYIIAHPTEGTILSTYDPINDVGFNAVLDTAGLFSIDNELSVANTATVGEIRVGADQVAVKSQGYNVIGVDGNWRVGNVLEIGTGDGDGYITSIGNGELILQTSGNDGPGGSIVIHNGEDLAGSVSIWSGNSQEYNVATFTSATTNIYSSSLAVNNIDGSEGSVASMTGFRAGWYGGSSGYSFKSDGAQDTGMFSWGDGNLKFINNSVDTMVGSADGWTFNQTATIQSASIGLNNGARSLSGLAANANDMKIENPNNGGSFIFATKNPSGVEKNVAISRQGNLIFANGTIGNNYPAGIGISTNDGGVIRLATEYDDGSTIYRGGRFVATNDEGIILGVDNYDYGTDTYIDHQLTLNYDGTIKLPQVDQTAATNYNFDASDSNVVTVATSATVTFSSFSGDILINDLYDGFVYKFLAGSGVAMMYADTNQYARGLSKTVTTGPDSVVGIEDYVSMEFTGGSYVFTNLATERDFSIFAVKTRNGG